MTFRTRPVEKRARRRSSSRSSEVRRTLILNLIFVGAIVAAIAILGAVVFADWYGQHWASVASVNGHSISKDDVDARAKVDQARYQQQLTEYQQLRNAGKITAADFSQQQQTLTGQMDRSTLVNNALSELKNDALILDYADKHGISVSDAQLQAQITKDGTIAEMRHIMVIGVQPQPADGAQVPTSSEIATAKAQAEAYLAELKGGKAWADVAKEANADYVSGGQDQGLNTKDNFTLDPATLNAAFGLSKVNDLTDVIEGQDGVFRIASVTSIVPSTPDPDWQRAIGANASLDTYRYAAKAEAAKALVQAQVEKQYIDSPTTQRHVLEIFTSASQSQSGGNEVKSRIAVFAPDKDPSKASSASQASWDEAKKRADDFFAQVSKDPSQFKTLYKNSDPPSWGFPAGTDLPYLTSDVFTTTTDQGGLGLEQLGTELFKPDVKVDQIFGPEKVASEGYLVTQFVGSRAPGEQRMNAAQLLINSGTDFATEASQVSEAPDATKGGDMGWIGRYQLSPDLEQAIFSTPVGQVSPAISNANGVYLFKIVEEQNRTPDATQAAQMRKSVFTNWLNELTSKANITSDPNGLNSLIGSPSPS